MKAADRIIEARDVADVRPRSSITHPLDDDRLFERLMTVANSTTPPTVRDIATAMLDAWSIVDSALPGLRGAVWKNMVRDQTADIAKLRDAVQHRQGEIAGLLRSGVMTQTNLLNSRR